VQRTGPTRPQPAKGTVVLETFTATPDPTSPLPAARSLVDRDEYGLITGRPGGLFTAAAIPSLPDERENLGRGVADWVPVDHLL
jgi:hypothetical protein